MTDLVRRIAGTDIAVHPVGVDGSVFGWASGVEETSRMLDCMVEYGGNLVSTADHYAGGRSEFMLGSWLAGTDRSRVVVATKVGRHPDARGLSSRMLVRAAEASLQRLQTDYVDFLTLDGVDPDTPIDETLEALDMLRRAGKARHLAVSGYPADKLREINALAETAKYPAVRLLSVPYNLMQRTEFEGELSAVVNELGIGVVARLPLASGFLTGGFPSRDFVPSSPLFDAALEHVGRHGTRVLQALEEVAGQRSETLGRTAIGWVLSKPGVVAVSARVKSADQLVELAGPGELVLTRQQVAALDRASAG